jgi:tRNA threonylcarbamoyladenosine biosynthesis protein TsaB
MTRVAIDTSTRRTTVAWESGGEILQLSSEEPRQARVLASMMQDVLGQIGGARALSQVVVGVGPGSFTALRIGISFAKGLCRAFDTPAIAVGSTLAACVEHAGSRPVLVAMDARKGELFGGIYGAGGKEIVPLQVDASEAWAETMRRHAEATNALVVGDGLDCSPELFDWVGASDRLPMDTHGPSARALLIYAAAHRLPTVQAGAIEPLYLRASDAELNGPRSLRIPVAGQDSE